jgi:tetratricopeptide (TPR) repeat protein
LPVTLEPLVEEVTLPSIEGYQEAIAWFETERDNVVAAVRAANAAGMDKVAWQIPAVLTMIIADRDIPETWLPVQHLALDSARRANDRYGEAITLDNLGIAYRHLFDLGKATDYFAAALTAFRDLEDTFGQARAANGLGVVHLFAHRIDDALACFQQALEAAHELEHHAFIGFFTRNIGWALLEGGDFEEAEQPLRQAAALLQEAEEPLEVAEALTLLAAVLRRSHRVAEARAAAEQALAMAGELDGTLFEGLSLLELGRIDLAQGEANETLARLQQAAALFWRIGRLDLQATAWDATGQAYVMVGRASEAADFHRRAVAAFRDRGDDWQRALALENLAAVLDLCEEPGQALEHRHEAVRLLNQFSDGAAVETRDRLTAALADE